MTMLTPEQQIRYNRHQAWLAHNQADLLAHYGRSLRAQLVSIDFYAAVEAVYVRLTFDNGSTIDLPIPDAEPEVILNEYQFGEERSRQ